VPDKTSTDWRQQQHDDFGAISARVASTERGIVALDGRLEAFGRDTTARFNSISQSISDVFDKLSIKIDAVNTSSVASRSTNWGTICAAAGVVLAFGTAIIVPIMSDLKDVSAQLQKVSEESVKKDDFREYHDDTAKWLTSQRDRLRTDEDSAVSQRQLEELKERQDERYRITEDANKTLFSRTMERLDALDAQLVKRPELQAIHDDDTTRINTLADGLHDLQSQIEGAFPPSKVIEDIQRSLSELRSRTGVSGAPGR
jgi:hypothetical protein